MNKPNHDEYIDSVILNRKNMIEDRIDTTLEIVNTNQDYSPGFNKHDIHDAHELANKEINPEIYNKELKEVLNKHLELYNKKYDTEIKFEDLDNFLTFASIASKEDKKVKDLIMTDLMSSALDFITQKTIFVLVKTVNTLLNNLQQRIYNENINEELLVTLDKLLLLQSRFENLKQKYSVHDLDTSIDQVQNKNKSVDQEDVRIVTDLIESMRKF